VTSRAIEALGLTEEQFAELRRMLPSRKLEAVKRYVEITNFGLAEAKAAIDAIERGAVPGGGPALTERPSWEAAVHQGVRALRKEPGASLYDAKLIADLAGVLPAGSRAPTQKEASEIGALVLQGSTDEAAARLGALFGLDPTTAADVAARLGAARRRPKAVFTVIALAILAAAAWFVWRVATP